MGSFTLSTVREDSHAIIRTNGYINDLGGEQIDEECTKLLNHGINIIIINFENSKIGYDLLTPDFTRKMMAFIIRMEPHSNRIALPLVKPTEQWMHVQHGRLKITVGDDIHTLNPGDTIYYEGDLLKEFCSDSEEELVILCCITPPAL